MLLIIDFYKLHVIKKNANNNNATIPKCVVFNPAIDERAVNKYILFCY